MNLPTENTSPKKLITKLDAVIITAVIVVSLAAAAFMFFRNRGETAVITIDGEPTHITVDLGEKDKSESFEVNGAVIETANGKIRVQSSDCPDKICVKTGYISKKGEKIVCLPKRLVIEITD